jgi:NAD(P)-dependent dehydrogenase (short-subunit alcohol dehydrogenase family)
MEPLHRIALITGGSRGIGAATTIALAERGFDVVFTYRNKVARAEEVIAEATLRDVRTLALRSDITRQNERDQLFAMIRAWGGRLDVLVLNASGGLERDLLAVDPAYPMHINRDAQVELLDAALPLMYPGSVVAFITSHWAHLYGQVDQIPNYAPVAESKYAGEQALRAQLPELDRRGIRLVVITGDLIEGTITPKLLERAEPGLTGQRQAFAGKLPTAEEMGEAIAAAAVDNTLPSGHTVVIGASLDQMLHTSR